MAATQCLWENSVGYYVELQGAMFNFIVRISRVTEITQISSVHIEERKKTNLLLSYVLQIENLKHLVTPNKFSRNLRFMYYT